MKCATAILFIIFMINFSKPQNVCKNGFHATFYNNLYLELNSTELAEVYYPSTNLIINPVYGNNSEDWIAKFVAYFAPIKGISTYHFRILKDDSVEIIIDDHVYLRGTNYFDYLPAVTVELDDNVLHNFTILLYQGKGNYALILLWSIDGSCYSEIPPSLFYLDNCTVPNTTIPENTRKNIFLTPICDKGVGLYGTYSIYNDSVVMNYSKIETFIDFSGTWFSSWSYPICSPFVDLFNFNATWRGSICIDAGSIISLSILSCQPCRVSIDGVVILNTSTNNSFINIQLNWTRTCRDVVLEYWSSKVYPFGCYNFVVKWNNQSCVEYYPFPSGVVIDSSQLTNLSFLNFDVSSIIIGNLTLRSDTILTLSSDINFSVTGNLFLSGSLILNQTFEKNPITSMAIYASTISGFFDEIQVLTPTCQSVTYESQKIRENSLLLLFGYERTCEPLGGGVIAAIVVSGFILLVIIVAAVVLGVPSLRSKIFPYVFNETK